MKSRSLLLPLALGFGTFVTGEVAGREAEHKIWFGHSAPKRCEFRVYDGNTGASVEFQEE